MSETTALRICCKCNSKIYHNEDWFYLDDKKCYCLLCVLKLANTVVTSGIAGDKK